MAGKGKAVKKTKVIQRKHHLKGWVFLTLLLCIVFLFLCMFVNASFVHVRFADVYLEDLPDSFEGTTILFASDIDLCGVNTIARVDSLFDELQSLSPDILLLGGDYASDSFLDYLNGGSNHQSKRSAFFKALADFEVPLGKFAVSGDNDGDLSTMKLSAVSGDVQVIDGSIAAIAKDDSVLYIVGFNSDTSNLSSLSSSLASSDCVILLTHSPDQISSARIVEAGDGGSWADLTLCGHTHGGQIRILNRTIFNLTDTEERYLSGWYTDSDPVLVTSGVGCEYFNLRFGSQAEVWLITLHCKNA